MTELQLGLIGLGAAAVVGVLIYNKVQEFRHKKVAERMLAGDHDDVLMGRGERRRPVAPPEPAPLDEEAEIPPEYLDIDDVRREPVLGRVDFEDGDSARIEFGEEALRPEEENEADAPPADDEEPEFLAEPVLAVPIAEPTEHVAPAPSAVSPAVVVPPWEEPVVPSPAPVPAAPLAAQAPQVSAAPSVPEAVIPVGEVPLALLDPRLDFVVLMELVEPVPGHQIRHTQRDAMARITKPVIWVGFNDKSREWETIAADEQTAYRRLRIGLQLADRRGPLSDADLTMFVAAMQQLSDELMAVADMGPTQGIIGKALALDRFCADVDLEIGVNLVCKGNPFTGTKIRALAEANGMSLDGAGRFTRFDDDGRALFSLQNFESTPFTSEGMKNISTHGLTFVLDVPRVDHGERVFFQMVDLARRAAETLQGMLVDDNRQPLAESQLDQIKREYVIKPQAAMVKFGIAAGSPQAQRLFS